MSKRRSKKITMTFEGNPNGDLNKVVKFIVLEELRSRKIIA